MPSVFCRRCVNVRKRYPGTFLILSERCASVRTAKHSCRSMDATRQSLQPSSTRTLEPRKKQHGSKEPSEESDFSKSPAWSLIPCIRFQKFSGCVSTVDLFVPSVRFLSVIGYVLSRLGLNPYIDYSLASRYLAFDIRQHRWSEEILAATEINAECLPVPVPAGTIAGKLDAAAAGQMGLSARTIVVMGGHDQPCGGLGVGAIVPGRVADSMGTYECLLAASDEPSLPDAALAASLNTYCHVVPNKFVTLAYFPSGIMIKWFHDLLYGEGCGQSVLAEGEDPWDVESLHYATLEREAPAGPTSLYITPNLIGTCNPDFNPHARGIISGLGPNTTRGQIYKGILEGLACEISQMTEILESAVGEFRDVYVTGGGSRSALGLQLRAALSGRRLHVMECPEAVCLGGAILAGVASGEYGSLQEAVDVVVREVSVVLPDDAIAASYGQHAKQYRQLCSALSAITGA